MTTELLVEDQTDMSKTFRTVEVTGIEDLDNIFEINPENERDWNTYAVRAKVDKSGELVFECSDKGATEKHQALLDSLLIRENSTITVNIHNAFIVSPKQPESGKYILLAGNSRFVFIRNLIDAFQNDLDKDAYEKYELVINPIKYQIKSDYSPLDLIGFQATDNQSVPLTATQTLNLVIKIRQMLIDVAESNEKISAIFPKTKSGEIDWKSKEASGYLYGSITNRLGLSHTVYYNAQNLLEIKRECPFLIGLLDEGLIKNPELALNIYRFSNKVLEHDSDLTPQEIWDRMVRDALAKNKPYPTQTHFTSVKKVIEKELGIGKKEESVPEVNNSDYEGEESPSDSGEDSPTPKMAEMSRLRELPREELNQETLDKIGEITNLLLECDPVDYENDDLVQLNVVLQDLQSRVKKVKTASQKQLIELEKKAEKERKAAEKAAAKQAEMDAKQTTAV